MYFWQVTSRLTLMIVLMETKRFVPPEIQHDELIAHLVLWLRRDASFHKLSALSKKLVPWTLLHYHHSSFLLHLWQL